MYEQQHLTIRTYLRSSQAIQIGFARLISDKSRFTWLADFFILPSHRGFGLGKALLHSLLDCSEFKVHNQMVDTRGSQELDNLLKKYAGFKATSEDKNETMYRFGKQAINPPLETALTPHPTLQEYFASANKDLLDIPFIHGYLITSYWSSGVSIEAIKCRIANSDCIGIYRKADNGGG